MKANFLFIIGCVFIILGATGCALINKPVQFVDRFIGQTFFPPYSGPKVEVMVADFEIKAAKATTDVGSDLRDMLIAGLNKTNRFLVVSATKEEIEKPIKSIIIATEVINFEPRTSGGSLGIGGGGSAGSGTLGSLLGTGVNKPYIAINIRIVDTLSSKVLASERITGQATETESAIRKKPRNRDSLKEGISAYVNTPIEQAIHKCIIEAVKYIVQNVPASYYKGDKNGKA